ncbi:MAG: cytochrome C oxidase subunit IV family protein [Myxococcaceae bacterium]|nr:cytochrome C oxidase subunit IV family protein [Myxococcaceae bacterium]
MRAATWALLVGLTCASVASGRLWLALVLAALKAVAVGLEFMELRHAARVHRWAFTGFVGLLTAGLLLAL